MFIKSKDALFEDHDSQEAVARRCSMKKVFLKILQNLQENTCVGVPF